MSEAAPSQEKSCLSTLQKKLSNKGSGIQLLNISKFALSSTINSEKQDGSILRKDNKVESINQFENEIFQKTTEQSGFIQKLIDDESYTFQTCEMEPSTMQVTPARAAQKEISSEARSSKQDFRSS